MRSFQPEVLNPGHHPKEEEKLLSKILSQQSVKTVTYVLHMMIKAHFILSLVMFVCFSPIEKLNLFLVDFLNPPVPEGRYFSFLSV